MKTKIIYDNHCNDNKFSNLLQLLSNNSTDLSTILHQGRNTLWSVNMNGAHLVIKKFGNGIKNRIIYSFIASKAKRSMLNAQKIYERGISTPNPIAYVEQRNRLGMLRNCWYISEYEQSQSYAEAKTTFGSQLINAFAKFVAELHTKGILHNDLNNTNVRVITTLNGEFHFSLIDLNRMHVYPTGKAISQSKWMKDVCRFCSINDGFLLFSTEYLHQRNLPNQLLAKMFKTKRLHDRKNNIYYKIKNFIKI